MMNLYLVVDNNVDGFYIVGIAESIERAKALCNMYLVHNGELDSAEVLHWRVLRAWEDGAKLLNTITAADYHDSYGTFYIAEMPLNKLARK